MTSHPDLAVLLDLDGTLLDSTYHHALAWAQAVDDVHLHAPMWRIHRAIGMGGDKLVASVLGDDVEERLGDLLRERWEERWGEVKKQVEPLPGAAPLVRRLRAEGLAVALASSGKGYMVDEAIERLGLARDDFAAVTTSDDAEESKPAPDILGVALERTGCERGLVIGDTTYDVTAAAHAGMPCVGVLTGGFSRGELEVAGAVRVVAELTELVRLSADDWSALADHPAPDAPDVRPGQ